MKSKKTPVIILLVISGGLLAGFIVKTALDYTSYTKSVNYVPFELRAAVNALLFVLPAAVLAYIAMFILGRTRALGITSAVFGVLTAATLVYTMIRYGNMLSGIIDGMIYALPFVLAAATGGIFTLISKRRAKTAK